MKWYPVPAPEGTPGWVNLVFVAGGAVLLVVLIWQAVRFFRDHRDD